MRGCGYSMRIGVGVHVNSLSIGKSGRCSLWYLILQMSGFTPPLLRSSMWFLAMAFSSGSR